MDSVTRMARAAVCALIAVVTLAMPHLASAAPILQVDGDGKLTGATAVNVNGTLYDVQFVDGTCQALFNGCSAASDFDFTIEARALAASQALIDQVFTGAFDLSSELIAGCTSTSYCDVLTPYGLVGDLVKIAVAYNLAGGSTDSAQPSFIGQLVTTDANLVFADWSPGVQTDLAAVSLPEPASLFLLGTGLAAAASASRRRRRAVAA